MTNCYQYVHFCDSLSCLCRNLYAQFNSISFAYFHGSTLDSIDAQYFLIRSFTDSLTVDSTLMKQLFFTVTQVAPRLGRMLVIDVSPPAEERTDMSITPQLPKTVEN